MSRAPGQRPPLRVVREGEPTPYPKASLLLRAGARLVDVLVAWGLFVACGAAGAVVALIYLLMADGMFPGQSVGKRIFGVKVMHLPTRSAGRHRDSALRNAPLALVVLLGMMPPPLGRQRDLNWAKGTSVMPEVAVIAGVASKVSA